MSRHSHSHLIIPKNTVATPLGSGHWVLTLIRSLILRGKFGIVGAPGLFAGSRCGEVRQRAPETPILGVKAVALRV